MDTVRQFFKKTFSITPPKFKENRIELLDFSRGCAMILVLLHHSGVPFGKYILTFHMALFFIISGYTEFVTNKASEESFGRYVWKKFKRVMIPYFVFEIINYVIFIVYCIAFNETIPTFDALLSIITSVNLESYRGFCGRLWFLPCIFVCNIAFWFIVRSCKKIWGFGVVICVSFGISYLISYFDLPRLPMMLDTMFMALPFLLIGYIAGNAIKMLFYHPKKWGDIIILVTALTIFIVSYNNGAEMYMHKNEYGRYSATIIAALSGSLVFAVITKYFYMATQKIDCVKNFVLWYGNNSLISFPMHLDIKCAMLFLGTIFPYANHWIIMLLIMLIFNIPAVNIFTNFFPALTGNFKCKKIIKSTTDLIM